MKKGEYKCNRIYIKMAQARGTERDASCSRSLCLSHSLAVWLRRKHLAWDWHAAPIRTLHAAYAQFVQGACCVTQSWAKYYNRAHNFSKLQLLISISIARPRTFLYNHPSLPPQAISSTKRPHFPPSATLSLRSNCNVARAPD